MEIKTSRVFDDILRAWVDGKRRVLLEGGTASTKTWSLLQACIVIQEKVQQPLLISVVSESLPHLKKGAIRDFFNILGESQENNPSWKITESTYKRPGWKGAIEFFGADNADKVRGPRRHILCINEGNNVPWETARGLDIRTSVFTMVDWNPVSSFWAHEFWVSRPENAYSHSTYLDAKEAGVLPAQTIADIEAYKDTDPNWWNIYGLGKLGKIEGLVYPYFDQVDALPAGDVFYGLDFGYSCLRGDTLITTDEGNKEIRTIKKGDMVLTRNGYREVTWSGSRGIKQVYALDFGYEKRIIITGDHLIYTAKGWKRADKLEKEETLCALKSNSTEKPIGDTLTENTRITSIANRGGTAWLLPCIGKYGKQIMEKFPHVALSTIVTATSSITVLKTLYWFLIANIRKSITEISSVQYPVTKCAVSGQNMGLPLITGQNAMQRGWIPQENVLQNVLNVVKQSRQQIPIKNSAALYAGKGQTRDEAKKNILVRSAGRYSQLQHISQETPVLQNVQVRSQLLKEKCEVFDLTVNGEHEFFANGILVHNCDPSALVANVIIGDCLYSDELIYETGLTNDDIARRMGELGILKHDDEIFADSAEPKSIEEIYRQGFNIKPAPKGPGSVEFRHQKTRQYKQHWTKDSMNCIKEQRNFRYIQDKNGKLTEKTTHVWSHGMDSRDYAVVGKAANPPAGPVEDVGKKQATPSGIRGKAF